MLFFMIPYIRKVSKKVIIRFILKVNIILTIIVYRVVYRPIGTQHTGNPAGDCKPMTTYSLSLPRMRCEGYLASFGYPCGLEQ